MDKDQIEDFRQQNENLNEQNNKLNKMLKANYKESEEQQKNFFKLTKKNQALID